MSDAQADDIVEHVSALPFDDVMGHRRWINVAILDQPRSTTYIHAGYRRRA